MMERCGTSCHVMVLLCRLAELGWDVGVRLWSVIGQSSAAYRSLDTTMISDEAALVSVVAEAMWRMLFGRAAQSWLHDESDPSLCTFLLNVARPVRVVSFQ